MTSSYTPEALIEMSQSWYGLLNTSQLWEIRDYATRRTLP